MTNKTPTFTCDGCGKDAESVVPCPNSSRFLGACCSDDAPTPAPLPAAPSLADDAEDLLGD